MVPCGMNFYLIRCNVGLDDKPMLACSSLVTICIYSRKVSWLINWLGFEARVYHSFMFSLYDGAFSNMYYVAYVVYCSIFNAPLSNNIILVLLRIM